MVAVGGYGRGELFPFSDVDVLILIDQEPDDANTAKLENFCGSGWDIGLEIGHSVRTLDQCVEEAAKDITVQTALVESRILSGNIKYFNKLKKILQENLMLKLSLERKHLNCASGTRNTRKPPTAWSPIARKALAVCVTCMLFHG